MIATGAYSITLIKSMYAARSSITPAVVYISITVYSPLPLAANRHISHVHKHSTAAYENAIPIEPTPPFPRC